ncbi:OsmC family protein [Candidatus Acetothermia bacterium]|nr:OsmC family protein [Candidatus Acetothermia bacterium]MBI3643517.1 OsmC family protein [Candidatus Acetothermia bacterium]
MGSQEQVYRVKGTWTGDLHGHGVIENERHTLKTQFAIPKSFGGPGGLTNPEEIFLSSACSCYLITLAMIAEKMKLPVRAMSCTAEGVVTADAYDGYHFKEIHLFPHIELDGADGHYDEAIARAVKLAEQRCIISRAVKGSVKYEIKHTVAV